ncbi:MalM family protein [Vibrio sp. HN007]|uniref:MalM family protein n=1 Tax=Vibrio iocasae TaxID=3098914 RepID=UPI0035D49898
MTNKKTIFAFALGALLTGCASDTKVYEEITPPTNQEVCCTDFSQFPFAQLDDHEDLKFNIDEGSPVGKFGEGNSHFTAFRFSERSADMQVIVTSEMMSDSVFAPQILLLDGSFQSVEKIDLSEFKVQASDAFTKTSYISKLKINASKTPYIVIYTPADQLGKKVTIDHPAKIRAKEFGEVMPMVTDPVYTYKSEGKIGIDIETLKLRPFKAIQPAKPQAEVVKKAAIKPQSETTKYYLSAIENAVNEGNIPKALGLLDEAKALNVEGAQEAFVNAVNNK